VFTQVALHLSVCTGDERVVAFGFQCEVIRQSSRQLTRFHHQLLQVID